MELDLGVATRYVCSQLLVKAHRRCSIKVGATGIMNLSSRVDLVYGSSFGVVYKLIEKK